MSITWGNLSFDGPYAASSWSPPNRAGLYAIMTKPEPVGKPDTYKIIYFGESGNLSDRGFFKAHHKYDAWVREAGSAGNLYVGLFLMLNSTPDQRQTVEQRLITQYKPCCND